MKTKILLLAGLIIAIFALSGCTQPIDNCGNERVDAGENCSNCPVDVKCATNETCQNNSCVTQLECKKEGETIPVIANPPSCCSGLTLIAPKEQILGISGICTAKCGNGTCDAETETNYNCPADCNTQLDSRCFLEPAAGTCKARIEKYYYNKDYGICNVFFWGGCEGVVPFNTQDECQQKCELKEVCEQIDGFWSEHCGLIGKCCNFRTTDSGQQCNSSEDCESMCMAETQDATSGRCSEWKTVFGCYDFFENGTIRSICVD